MADPAPPPDDAARWETIAAEARTLHGGPGSTIEPQGRRGRESGLPTVVAASDADRLELGAVLGEGGMGVVRLATHRTMGRAVAVKTVRPALRQEEYTRKLLQEAWTAGRLEHPNIIPVYDIAIDPEGHPLIVLKRIEGESWASLLEHPERAAALVDGVDELDRNLRVLAQVCRAAHFAHTRGVVHLDIKPDNVMLGQHGEVHLVDWGVAMALRDDGTGQLRLAEDHRGIVGTPHYLAPEMLEGQGSRLDARTDVYLLGATLFELLTGHPPHGGETTMAVLHAVMADEPALPDDAPAELAEICRRAMARDPQERYPSAEAMRRALQAYERHRESARIAALAGERLGELEALARGEAPAEHTRQTLFSQARFGFEQALDSWPDNAPAREGLGRAFELMVELELEHGDPQVSAALAREAPALPEALRRRVEKAVAERQAGLDELASRRRDQDLRIGQRTRVFVMTVFGIVWTVLPLIEHFYSPELGAGEAYLFYSSIPLASEVLLLGLVIWARESLLGTLANRVIVGTIAVILAGQIMMMLGGYLLQLPPTKTLALMPLLWTVGGSMVVLTVERRAVLLPVVFLATFFAGVLWNDYIFLAIAVCDFCFSALLIAIWWPARLRGPIPVPDDHRA